jgi:hypothetical protein
MVHEWTCSICGASHEGIPLSWGFDEPIYWEWLTDEERAAGHCSADLCWFTDDDGDLARFVRGTIELPIRDPVDPDEDSFIIGVWASLSEANFNRYVNDPDAGPEEQGDAWFGWLSNRIPVYEDTLNLKTNISLRGKNLRPLIDVQPSDHLLSCDVHEGITLGRARELGERWLHLERPAS